MATLDLKKTDTIFVSGHSGLLGSALVAELHAQGYSKTITIEHTELDLTNQNDTYAFLNSIQPKAVFHCAALVGGIQANSKRPAEFVHQNLMMQANVIHGSHLANVSNLIFFGSNCMYPTAAPQPMTEAMIMQGPMEPSNLAYGSAKVAGVVQTDSYRKQYGRRYFSILPCSLYGPNDCFDPEQSHVTPALLLKFHRAKVEGTASIEMWGTGTPRRELMHASDAARGAILLLEKYDASQGAVNLGAGYDLTITEIANAIGDAVGYHGKITFDLTKPDGNMRKLLDSTRANSYGFKPQIALADGLKSTYEWFKKADSVRGVPSSLRSGR